ncbi:protein of unknown function [Kyrpidia spormannii]|uniref:Uncharacterized protein n=2 Tax=Kyrpidia spormannii TaxID=2055160 RepID=A0ACA8ZC35_9BACL|nr:protein of unknown function [Kyrpidia spormannii]CAB3394813.1 protein of unknown function [Kyrpidia spormannii]
MERIRLGRDLIWIQAIERVFFSAQSSVGGWILYTKKIDLAGAGVNPFGAGPLFMGRDQRSSTSKA